MRLLPPLFMLSFCCLFFEVSAQANLTLYSHERAVFDICQEQELAFTIVNNEPYPIHNVQLTIGLASGISYLPGTLTDVRLQEIDVSNTRNPIFGVAVLYPCTEYQFSLNVDVSCVSFPNNLRNEYALNTSEGNFSFQSQPFDIRKPVIEVLDTYVDYDTLNGIYYRSIIIANLGLTSIDDLLLLNRGYSPNYSILATNTGVHQTFPDSSLVQFNGSHFSALGNNDPHFDPGEILTLIETISLEDCQQVLSNLSLHWPCGETDCQLWNDNYNFQPLNGQPRLSWYLDDYQLANNCEDGWAEILIVNTGAGTAFNVVLEPGLFSSFNSIIATSCPQLMDFSINNLALVEAASGYTGYGLEIFNQTWANTDPDGFGGLMNLDNDGLYDDLAVEDTIRLQVSVQMNGDCIAQSTSQAIAPYRALGLQAHYQSGCNDSLSNGARIYNYSYEIPEVEQETEINATSFYEALDVVFSIKVDKPLTGYSDACPGHSMQLELNLPPSISLRPDSPIVFNDTTVAYSQNGSTVQVDGYFESGWFSIYGISNCDFDTTLVAPNCTTIDGYLGYSIQYDLLFICDPENCDDSFSLISGNSPCFTVFCGETTGGGGTGSPCQPPPLIQTTIDMARTSLGWTDSSQTELVDPQTTDLNLDFALSYDTVQVHLSSEILGFSECLILDTAAFFTYQGYAYRLSGPNPTYINPLEWIDDQTVFLDFYDSETNTTYQCVLGEASLVSYIDQAESIPYYGYQFNFGSLFASGGCLENLTYNIGDSLSISFLLQVTDENLPTNSFDLPHVQGGIGSSLQLYNWEAYSPVVFSLANGTPVTFYTPYGIEGVYGIESLCNLQKSTVFFGDVYIAPDQPFDPFPNEFRPWAQINEIIISLPSRLEFNTATTTFNYWQPVFPGSDSLEAVSIAIQDPAVELIDPFYESHFLEDECGRYGLRYQNDNWPAIDYIQNGGVTIESDIQLACSAKEDYNYQWSSENGFYISRVHFEQYLYTNPLNQDSSLRSFYGEIYDRYTRLDISDRVYSNVTDTIAHWEIELCNPNSVENSDSLDWNWITFEPNNDNLYDLVLVNINDTINPDTLTLEAYGNDNHYWAQLGSMPADTCLVFQLSAKAINCETNQINIRQGLHCLDYPVSLEDLPCYCKFMSDSLTFRPDPFSLVLTILEEPDSLASLCDPLDYTLLLENVNIGRAYTPTIDLYFPFGNSLEIVPGSATFQGAENADFVPIPDPVLIEPGRYQWAVSAFMDSLFLPGVGTLDSNQVAVHFQVQPSCFFQNGSFIWFKASGGSVCDQREEAIPRFAKPLEINRTAESVNSYDVQYEMLPKTDCDEQFELVFTVTNLGGSPTGLTNDNEGIQILLANHFSYQANSLVGIYNFPDEAEPEQSMSNSINQLSWMMPTGVMVNDSIVFSIRIENSCERNCNALELSMQTTILESFECDNVPGGSCVISSINTKHTFTEIPLTPTYVFTAAEMNPTPLSIGADELTVQFTLADTTAIDGYGELEVQFFQDLNSNGIIGATDSLLSSTFIDASYLTAQTAYQYTASIPITTTILCDIIAVLNVEENDCTCNASQIIIPASNSILLAAPDRGACFGESLQLAYPSTDEYTYVWSNSTFMDDSTSSQPIYQYSGTAVPANSFTETIFVEVTASPTCLNDDITGFDTIQLTTYFLDATIQGTNTSCANTDDGTAFAEIHFGEAPYDYLWSNGSADAIQTNLTAGTHQLTITDARDCSIEREVLIGAPPPIAASLASENSTCVGASDGQAWIVGDITGGTGPYSYIWCNGDTTSSADNLSAGVCSLTITDTNGCNEVLMVDISEPPALDFDVLVINEIACWGGTGSFNVVVNGGSDPYDYLWNTGDTTAMLTDIVAGNYSLTLTDVENCTHIQSFNFTEPAVLAGEIDTENATCFAAPNGQVSVEGNMVGGTPPYSYLWNTGENTETISNLAQGTYSVTVTDQQGCIWIEETTVEQPLSLSANIIATSSSCEESENGSILVSNIIGGTAPYQFLLNGIEQGATEVGALSAGQYAVKIVDAKDCVLEMQVSISIMETPEPLIETTAPTCWGFDDGTLNLSGLPNNYTYSLDQINFQNQAYFDQLPAGEFAYFIQDELGCEFEYLAEIPPPSPIDVSLSPDTIVTLGETVSLLARPLYRDAETYEWFPVDFLSCSDCPNPTSTPHHTITYEVQVTDIYGCVAFEEVTIRVSKNVDIYIPNAFSPNDDGINDRFTIYSQNSISSILKLAIFDRWGALVFEQENLPPNQPSLGWDGKRNQKPLNVGVYVFAATIQLLDGSVIIKQGDIVLIR